MSKEQRTVLDDIGDRLRGLLEELDRLLKPEPPAKPARVPVPVPVRRPQRDPYNQG